MINRRLKVDLDMLLKALSRCTHECKQRQLKIVTTLDPYSDASESPPDTDGVRFLREYDAQLTICTTRLQARENELEAKLAELRLKTDQLAESNSALEKKSAELEQVNAGLKAVLEQREDFIAALTHDLKNPLIGCIRVLEHVLAEKNLPCVEAELLNVALRTLTTMLRMIFNVLDGYKFEYNSLVPLSESVNVPVLLKECLEEARFSIAEKHLLILMEVGQENLWIHTDATLLRRVLMNLIDNAVKFSPVGGRFGIRLSCFESHISIAISDSGGGISRSELKQVFKRFWQTDSGRRSGVGTGLGLYLSKQILELLGGSIECTSRKSVGTEFTISLPLPNVLGQHVAQRD